MWIAVIAIPGSQDDNYRHCVITGPDIMADMPLPKIDPYTGQENDWRNLALKFNHKESAETTAHAWKMFLSNKQKVSAWVEEL